MSQEVEMTAILAEPPNLVLTAEQYEALPPYPRTELVDGVLYPMTPPTLAHQMAVSRIERALELCAPDDYFVSREQELRLGELHRRLPDVMVVRAELMDPDGRRYPPPDVLLAVEVISPTSRIVDRVHKAAEYAGAGVAHYWLIETSPELALYTHVRDGHDRYRETGRFATGDLVAPAELPWAQFRMFSLDRRP